MLKRYTTIYNSEPVIEADIDTEKALPYIKEMAEFWVDWEYHLEQNNGDYFKVFFEQLTRYVFFKGELPINEEGWYPFTEEYGFKYIRCWSLQFDRIYLDITEEEWVKE